MIAWDNRQLESNLLRAKMIRGCLHSLALPVPFFVGFWQMHGMTMQDIALLQVLFSLALLLADIPGGYFADLAGRKLSIVCGGVILALGDYSYSIGEDFNEFLLAEFLLALGLGLVSGADDALVKDSLLASGEGVRFAEVRATLETIDFSMACGGFFLGSVLFALGLDVPMLLLVACSTKIALVVIALGLVEPPRQQLIAERGHLRELGNITWTVIRQPSLRWMLYLSGGVTAIQQVGFWMYQPYFKLCGLKTEWNGVILAVLAGWAAYVSLHSARFSRFSPRAMAILVMGAPVIGYALASANASLWTPMLFLLPQTVRPLIRNWSSVLINELTNSRERATVLSINSAAGRVCYLIALLCAGSQAETVGVQSVFGWLAVFGCLMLIALWLGAHNSFRRREA